MKHLPIFKAFLLAEAASSLVLPPKLAAVDSIASRWRKESDNFLRTARLLACTAALAWTTTLPLPPGLPPFETGGSAHAATNSYLKPPGPGGFQSLSRAGIQAKLNTVPVFYLPDAGGIRRDLYLSYDDAVAAAFSSGGKPTDVRATTLDQVYYPLILRRGRMRMAPPPPGITAAEASLVGDAVEGAREVYRLVPSAAAVAGLSAADAKDIDVGGVDGSGVPVFSAERLAFAGPEGPQLPLFFNEQDCAETYQRLRLSPRGNGRLPEKPVIRVSSLFDQVKSMERGDKPVLNSYAFYSNNYDLIHAQDLIGNAFQ